MSSSLGKVSFASRVTTPPCIRSPLDASNYRQKKKFSKGLLYYMKEACKVTS